MHAPGTRSFPTGNDARSKGGPPSSGPPGTRSFPTGNDARSKGGPPSSGPPFFIVGSARSGTTLLRLMLNAHPEVAVPPESRFITELWRGHLNPEMNGFLGTLSQHPRFQTWDLPIEAVADEIADQGARDYPGFIAAAFQAFARAHGKKRWGDKTPRYVEHLELLAQLFPDARFIHLIRDGRDVALSYADVPFGPKTVGRAARLWARRVRAGCNAGRALAKGHYLEVNYEDLVDDTAGEIKDICDFLELDFDPGMLDHTERARGSVLPRASMYNPNVVKPPSKTRSWRDEMDPRHVEAFEAIAGDVLSELGYERRHPTPALRARIVGRLGDAGLPLGRLKGSRH